jgi:HEAT repeat protein
MCASFLALTFKVNERAMSENKSSKKILENPFLGSLMVPIAIVLVGALIIFGITKMLSTERSYKDLVQEMQSKTFGNRWIAAYELSKQIISEQIPEEEKPWLVENLVDIYKNTPDPRTKNFIVVALGTLQSPLGLPVLTQALSDEDHELRFQAVVALGNLKNVAEFDWTKVSTFLSGDDAGLRQAAIYALATHRVALAKTEIEKNLTNDNPSVKYAAAIALINYRSEKALPLLQEILELKEKIVPATFNDSQIESLKLNLLETLSKESWSALDPLLVKIEVQEKNIRVISKIQGILNKLKK